MESRDEATATGAKMQLIARASELMPQGKPLFADMRYYPMIAQLITEHGRPTLHKAVLQLVKNFCASINVVRNMNEDQMIEAAGMLLDECGNFRLEDYLMMFSMAKRGNLIKILDRVDIQVIGQMLDEYWTIRNAAGNRAQDEQKPKELPVGVAYVGTEKVSAALRTFLDEVRRNKEAQEAESEKELQARREEMLRRRRALWENQNPDEVKLDAA